MFIPLDQTHYVRARAISAVQVIGQCKIARPDQHVVAERWQYHVVLRDAPPIDFETGETPDQLVRRLNAALLAKATNKPSAQTRLEEITALPRSQSDRKLLGEGPFVLPTT